MEETELKIRLVGDSVLSGGVKQVEKMTDYHRRVLSAMARFMYEVQGVGLAAPQVGINESLIVVDVGSGLYKLANPEIITCEGESSAEEGCLSVPGVGVKVKRAKKIMIKALDEDGKDVSIEAEGLLARAFQHELDHLNGKLIIDHASASEKARIGKKIEEIKKQYKTQDHA